MRCPLQATVVREVCENGEWVSATPCESGTLCDRLSDGDCVGISDQCLGQQAGAAFCSGATRLVCSDDLVQVSSETCDSAAHCNQATGPDCASCLEGESSCDGDILKRCNDDHSDFVEVEKCTDAPCNALLGECTDRVCDAGAYYCDAASNTLSRCNQEGTGFESESVSCGAGICDAANGQCDECQPGVVLGCADAETQELCESEGQGTIGRACAELDDETPICVGEGQCVECHPLSAECIDEHQIRRCSAEGKWEATETCVDQACVDDSCVGVCSPGDRDCASDTSVTTCQSDGTWGTAVSCGGQACVGAGCTGECEPTTAECADKFSRKVCTTEGSWGDAITCTGQACVGGACVGVCVPETKRCNNGKVETCSDQGTWGNPVTCTDQTCVESGTTASCQGVCAPDYQRCNNNNVQNCNSSGQYSGMLANCTTSGQTCVATGTTASCQGTCAPGYQRCNNNVVQNCNTSGSYSGTAANCTTAGQTCVASGTTAACQGTCAPGYQRCNNNNVQNCNASGSYSGTADNCTNKGNTCVATGNSASCSGTCIAGNERCSSNTPQACDDTGTWQSESAMCTSPNFICEVDAGDAECVSNPPYTVGYDSAFAATTSAGLNFLLGNPITLDRRVRVLQFGLLANAQASCRVHMLLYSDNAGSPGALQGFSAEATPPNIAAGRHELAPNGQLVVNAGKYWLMAHYNCAATILAFDNDSAPDLKYVVASYGSAPDPFPTTGVSTIPTLAANHYLNVQNAP